MRVFVMVSGFRRKPHLAAEFCSECEAAENMGGMRGCGGHRTTGPRETRAQEGDSSDTYFVKAVACLSTVFKGKEFLGTTRLVSGSCGRKFC